MSSKYKMYKGPGLVWPLTRIVSPTLSSRCRGEKSSENPRVSKRYDICMIATRVDGGDGDCPVFMDTETAEHCLVVRRFCSCT